MTNLFGRWHLDEGMTCVIIYKICACLCCKLKGVELVRTWYLPWSNRTNKAWKQQDMYVMIILGV